MSHTPLYDALRAFADTGPLRFHMPGHHGKPLPAPELSRLSELDFTELPPTGDLFSPGGPIEAAEKLWAAAFGMSACLFLTGGSTQGLHTALTLACSVGGGVLVDRGCHRSVYHSMALLDLQPVYLPRPWLTEEGVTGPISPQLVDNELKNHPDIKTVCITSPTYYGVLSDIFAIAQVVHAHGGTLVVDGAHGAHLPFLGLEAYGGADLVVCSAHKTLPAPGQTALLFSSGTYSLADLRRAGSIYGSSSPSYPMMAALDLCRAALEDGGATAYGAVAEEVAALRAEFPALRPRPGLALDPCRLVLNVGDGFGVKGALEGQGVYPEMADVGHVVFIATCADGAAEFARLRAALEGLSLPPVPTRSCPGLPGIPPLVVRPRQALFAPRRYLPLRQAEGEVCGVQVAPYPPGVPVIAPGERIEKKHLSYLTEIGYNTDNTIGVITSPCAL